jgi:hypothetical protein
MDFQMQSEKPNLDMPTSWFDEIDLTTDTGKKQCAAKRCMIWQWQASQWPLQEKGLYHWLVRQKSKNGLKDWLTLWPRS